MTGIPQSPEVKAAAVQRVIDGETRVEVAASLNVGAATVARWCLDAGLPRSSHGGARVGAENSEKQAEARKMVSDGISRVLVAETLGVRRTTVLRWTADLPDPPRRLPSKSWRSGIPDDGIVDEVAVERALRFDPAAIAALRPSEYRAFTDGVRRLLASRWFETTPRYESWLALPENDRLTYADAATRRDRRALAATPERIAA